MLPDAVMMAEETKGPMNADVLPTTEKSAKKRNLCMYVVGAWVTGSVSFSGYHRRKGNWDRGRTEIAVCVHLGQWGDFADHRLAVCVPRAHHQAIVCLVQPGAEAHELRGLSGEREVVPDLPDVLKPNLSVWIPMRPQTVRMRIQNTLKQSICMTQSVSTPC